MAKSSVIYECSGCGAQSPKWAGQCGECGKWNTLSETLVSDKISNRKFPARNATQNVTGGSNSQIKGKLLGLDEVEGKVGERVSTRIGELDRVLGGGLVAGEVVLMVGEPGIGKSTLLTQLSLNMSNVVYVCGEESPGQVKIRVNRMGGDGSKTNLKMLAEMDVDTIVSTVNKEPISLLIIDSVQTIYTSDLPGLAGSVSQIRECTGRIIAYAKSKNVPVILVGHVTKDGEMAGPKVLEHMVDAVLELTGDRYYDLRLLRTQKNRFGATDEVGVFRMNESGMEEITNPSELFLSEREEGSVGSAIAVVVEGTRPVLLEVQALVVNSELPVPRRVSQGVDVRRVQILLGVLQKYTKLSIGTKDVFVKVTGGLTVREPAIDLAVVLAVASSASGKSLPKKSVAIGEVGLLGEIRNVNMYDKRVKEANKLGYTTIYSKNSYRKVAELVKSI
ncbi:MAG: DNA repair protein RadA [bacterium]|nr:DNA repair protein RadA [Candidatus Microgenomates bacterium CPR3]MCQ3944393.1 DNA repair protein RadA [bacterium]RIK51309.1 MAG: DNA repair protein RadA [Candidatus Microgenomates bacterium]